jgi:hypothetical protein
VLDTAASNIDGILSRGTCVSSAIHNEPFFILEISDFQEVFISKTNSILSGKQCAKCSCFYTVGFIWSDTCVSSNSLIGLFGTK